MASTEKPLKIEQLAKWTATALAVTALVLLVAGLAWPTPAAGSCGNDLKPPAGAPQAKIYTLFAAGLTGVAAAVASLLIPSGGTNRGLRWTLFLAGSAITVIGLGASFAYSFPPCGMY
jgi:hypothetical protein